MMPHITDNILMKKTFIIAITVVVISTLFIFIRLNDDFQSEKKKLAEVQNQKDLVTEAFNGYKSSILNDKGDDAVYYVDTNTIKYYEKVLELAKNADRKEMASLSLFDKFMVIIIRYRVTKEDIFSFDGKKLLIYAINNGMVGKDSVVDNSMGEVVLINENLAKGEMLVHGKKGYIYIYFHRENGAWKIDLTSIIDVAGIALKKTMEDSGQTEDDFIFSIIELSFGKKPDSNIWNPLK
jgi:hypothetical protein